MKKALKFTLGLTLLMSGVLTVTAQVGVGTTNPQSSLDIAATNQATPANTDGILIPRVDAFPATNPTATQDSMIVYLTTTSGLDVPGFYYWNNATTTWLPFGAGATLDAWELTGNAGTTPGTNFVGTTDANALSFATNSTERLRIADGYQVLAMDRGTQTAPFYSFNVDDNTGVWSTTADHLSLGAGGVEFIRLRERTGQDELVFNLPGQDIDFRVESDTNANAFVIDGATAAIRVADYGAGSNTGTVTQYLAVDSNGNIIEEPVTSANGDFWTLLGNAGTNATTNFIGTTDAVDIVTRTNNIERTRVFANGVMRVGVNPLFTQDIFTATASNIGDHAVNGYSPDITGVGVYGSQDPTSLNFKASGGSFDGSTLGVYGSGNGVTSNGVEGSGGNPATGFALTGSGGIFNASNIGVLGYSAGITTTRAGGIFEADSNGGGTLSSVLAGSFASANDFGILAQADEYGVYAVGGVYGVISIGDMRTTNDMIVDNNIAITNNFTAGGTKAFTIDHPTDPENKKLRHFSMESDEVLNFYRGNIVFDANGEATVSLPDYFHAINRDVSYQLTPVGASMPGLFVKKEVTANGEFVIAGGVSGKKVSWQVTAERNDKYIQANPESKVAEVIKTADEKGKYIHPEAWGQSKDKYIRRAVNEVHETESLKKVNLGDYTQKKVLAKMPK